MNSLAKLLLLGIVFIISISSLFYLIDFFNHKGIELQKQVLLQQAQTHFDDQVNTRNWNAQYGGVYVKPLKGQKPNPYLRDNTLKVDENLTLIKINPAWMTRQLSEISNTKGFHFRLSSLIPINPNNKATPFEQRALKYFEKTNQKEYYELDENTNFNYMGALYTTTNCLPCHQHQGYMLGDIRGGISIDLDSSEYKVVTSSIKEWAFISKIFVVFFLLSITLLIYKQLKHSEKLQSEVGHRTKEIESTKQLLQQIIDTDASFIILADEAEIVYANQTILKFSNFSSIVEFNNNYENMFEKVTTNKNFLQPYNDGLHWIRYLKKEQDSKNSKDLKILVKKDGQKRYFRPHAKEISTDEKILYLITFDEITHEYTKIQELEQKAETDSLTKLFNRHKLNDVLNKEIALCHAILSPLSIIFLDVDHFKLVNDTYGHDVGDKILVTLASIIISMTRQGDIAARWGGEEFMITLQATNASNASILAQKLRVAVEEYNFDTVGKLTISLGVTEYLDNESEEDFIKRADNALYEAKDSGRNRVVIK